MVVLKNKFDEELNRQETMNDRSGRKVEVKPHPGAVPIVAEGDPVMDRPIRSVHDRQPHGPEELKAVRHCPMSVGSFKPAGGSKVRYLDFQGHFTEIGNSM
ncbi:hypothetical protein [Kamptonema formosum]|uniref:hypothetical protein n=1 Tax=Kamptonema formosum TaxID=331992 RepID=UPI000345778C|nr:hypothetical protein [Oscillatoria sp. PCC 10802]